MSLKLKVCGMRDQANMLEVASLQPDYMGFIFYAGSPRFVGPGFTIPDEFPSTIRRVGVFVNESEDVILKQAARHQLSVIQLHGDETPAFCEAIKQYELQVIKAVAVDDSTDFARLQSFHEVVDYFLFDTKGNQRGGNAQPFDWRLLNNYDQRTPFFLAGGLSADIVPLALQHNEWNLHAVDINSLAERSPGMKDIAILTTIKQQLVPTK